MIDVICDHCKKDIINPRTELNRNFNQVLGDDGKVEADLCKSCYKVWCEELEGIDTRRNKTQKEEEIIFKLGFLHKISTNKEFKDGEKK